jgi:predicted peroxiredoxin
MVINTVRVTVVGPSNPGGPVHPEFVIELAIMATKQDKELAIFVTKQALALVIKQDDIDDISLLRLQNLNYVYL